MRLGLAAALAILLAACGSGAPTPAPSAAPTPAPTAAPTVIAATPTATVEPQPAGGLPPEGTWQVELTSDDFVNAGFSESVAPAGTYTWIFSGDTARTEVEQSSGEKIVCNATMSPLATGFQLTYGVGKCGGEIDEISWTLEDDGLHLTLITTNAPVDQNKAYIETKPWQPVTDN